MATSSCAEVLSRAEVEALREVTDDFVERARALTSHDEIYDLEDSHSAAEPRVRRIKTPHRWHDDLRAGWSTIRTSWPCCRKLWGPAIRFDISKLNLKSAGYGAPVEWHQDWAFYPHTNDDLAAVGIMMDDVDDDQRAAPGDPGQPQGPDLRSPRRSALLLRRHGPGARRGRLLARRCR